MSGDSLQPVAQARNGRRARIRRHRHRAEMAAIDLEESTMTPDEIEAERAALLAELEKPGPLTDELRDRIAAVAAADAAEAPSPWEEAVGEALAEMLALAGRDVPPGLSVRTNGPEWIDVLDGAGALVGRLATEPIRRRAAGRLS